MLEQMGNDPDGDCLEDDRKHSEIKSDSFLFFMAQEGTRDGILRKFQAQLDSVSDVDAIRDSRRNTLLHSAVSSGNVKTVEILIQKGANVLAVNLECDTPLSLAKSAFLRSNRTQNDKEIFFLIRSSLEEIQGTRSPSSDPETLSSLSISDSETASTLNITNALHLNGEEYEFDDIDIPAEEIERCHDPVLDLEVDDLGSLTEKIGVVYPVEEEVIYLPTKELRHVITYRDSKGRSLLTRFAENGNLEVLNFLLKCRGLDVNSLDDNQRTAAEISWSKQDYLCFLTLIRNDASFPRDFRPSEIKESELGAMDLKEFVERRTELHKNIEAGNMEAIVEATKFRNSSLYLNWNNESALHCSIRRRNNSSLKIYAYFLFINLSFGENEKVSPFQIKNFTEEEYNMLNNLLDEYAQERETYHIQKLMASSKVLGEQVREKYNIVENVYRRLNNYQSISLLMKVLKYETFEVFFNFEREHRQCPSFGGNGNDCPEQYNRAKKTIYIGAKKYLCTTDSVALDELAGVLAHEICHAAMDVLYDNNHAKPYKRNEDELMKCFEEIVQEIRLKITNSSGEIHKLIKVVFEAHKSEYWHSELIAIVPQILAMYGELEGNRILKSQAPKLYEFFESKIVPHSKEYSREVYFTNNLMKLKNIRNCKDYLNSRKYYLKNEFQNFHDCLNTYENVSILVTTNVSLCHSLIYRHLMNKYSFHFDKTCLFFDLCVFMNSCEIILNAYKCEVCDYLILYTDDKDINYQDISRYFSNDLIEKKNRPILILRSDCKELKYEWKRNIMNYQWNDLSCFSKSVILDKKVDFQGQEIKLGNLILELTRESSNDISKSFELSNENVELINDDTYAPCFQPDVLSYLMSQDDISIGNSKNLTFFSGYRKECYVHRSLSRGFSLYLIYLTVEESSLRLFIDLLKGMVNDKKIDEPKIKVLTEEDDALRDEHFVVVKTWDKRGGELFKEICKKKEEKLKIHYYCVNTGEVCSNMSRENSAKVDNFWKVNKIGEEELIQFSDSLKERNVTIWGESGTGKSAVVTEIITRLKEKNPCTWIGRINLDDFSGEIGNQATLARLEQMNEFEEVLGFVIDILGLKSCLERKLFQMALKITRKVRIFIDGYDEVIPLYENCVINLLRHLIEGTSSQVWVTNRRHEGDMLERKLFSFSYTLERLPFERQLSLLDKIWKSKLKLILSKSFHAHRLDRVLIFQKKIAGIHGELKKNLKTTIANEHNEKLKVLTRGLERVFSLAEELKDTKDKHTRLEILKNEIDEIDFTPQASAMIKNMTNSMVDGESLLASTPMILSMIALLAFKRNLQLDAYKDTYSMYENYVKEKIRVYLRRRNEFQMQSSVTESKIFELHQMLALKVLKQQPWEPTKFPEEAEILLGVGIVVQTQGKINFAHRTFAEFFVSHRIVENVYNPELIVNDLEEVLVKFQYATVRRFLNERYKKPANKEGFEFSDELVERMNVSKTFLDSISKNNIDECNYVWSDIIIKCEKCSSVRSFMNFIEGVGKSNFDESDKISTAVFQVLSHSLSDESLVVLFDATTTTMYAQHKSRRRIIIPGSFKKTFIWASTCSESAFSELLHMLKRVLCIKAYLTSPYHKLTESLLGGKDKVNKKFEEVKIPYGMEETMKILEEKDSNGWTILHAASKNKHNNVFPQMLAFLQDILGGKRLGVHFTVKNYNSLTILHLCSMSRFYYFHCDRVLRILEALPQFLDHKDRINIIKHIDDCGFNFLHYFVWNANEEVVGKILLHLRDEIGCEDLKSMLLHRNQDGLNVLQQASNNKDINVSVNVLNYAKGLMDEKEFVDFVAGFDEKGNTIFHTRASLVRRYPDLSGIGFYKQRAVGDLVVLFSFIEDEALLRRLLIKANNDGETFLHKSVNGKFSLSNFYYATDMLDEESLNEFLSERDSDGEGYLHKIAKERNCIDIFHALTKLKEILTPQSFGRLTEMRNSKDESVMDVIRRNNPEVKELIQTLLNV